MEHLGPRCECNAIQLARRIARRKALRAVRFGSVARSLSAAFAALLRVVRLALGAFGSAFFLERHLRGLLRLPVGTLVFVGHGAPSISESVPSSGATESRRFVRKPCTMKRRGFTAPDRDRAMVLGYHFIFSAYGFWLPNDPRGSWSEVVREFELLQFGPATKVHTTRSVARRPHDVGLRLKAKEALRYRPVRFTGIQARAIARGFTIAAQEAAYSIHALAILPDHVHLVMSRHGKHIDLIAGHLKSKATFQLTSEKIHPLARFASKTGHVPSPWSRNYWCPFIRSVAHLRDSIGYVERNPIKAGLRAQRWSVVVPHE